MAYDIRLTCCVAAIVRAESLITIPAAVLRRSISGDGTQPALARDKSAEEHRFPSGRSTHVSAKSYLEAGIEPHSRSSRSVAPRSDSNLTGGLYYSLTKSVTLAGELGQTRSKDFLGNEAKQFGGSIGGIIFF